ncbi:unnamed protein product [Effrenium voratum]|uniref:PPM-type phosphatase domain-containing protein n=1 Tax=Effrenium voratum TaxID=2562239 RepID=A0AA36NFI4_9DINO|nr:unnamed protein product [Effrenium voratum]CAJ1422116.1 unnamed protein product [Effrenium voratum]
MVSRFVVGRRAAKPAAVPEAEAPLLSASSPGLTGIEGKQLPRCRVEVATHTAKNWGGRHENEDRCMAAHDCLGDQLEFHTVGVLDGHDTDSASDLVAKLLPGAVGRRIKEGLPISEAYMEAMAEMEDRLKREHATAGTCVNSCTIAGGRVWCANLGDCRAALVTLEATPAGAAKAEQITWLSRDHKASCPTEQKRIEAVGGCVIEGRVEGLEPSRTLGDFDVKMTVKPGVISIVPEVRTVDIGTGKALGRRAVLMCATDGIWDVMSGQDLCKLTQARKDLGAYFNMEALAEAPKAGMQALKELAEDIVQFALAKGSRDAGLAQVICWLEARSIGLAEALQGLHVPRCHDIGVA